MDIIEELALVIVENTTRRITGEILYQTLPRFLAEQLHQIFIKHLREVVEGAGLTDEEEFKIQAKSSSVFNELLVINTTAKAQLQAILKAMED